MKCKECPYFFSDTDDRGNPISRESCHYRWNDGYAPCEVEDTEAETEDTDEE